jgi:hypothetical protein
VAKQSAFLYFEESQAAFIVFAWAILHHHRLIIINAFASTDHGGEHSRSRE